MFTVVFKVCPRNVAAFIGQTFQAFQVNNPNHSVMLSCAVGSDWTGLMWLCPREDTLHRSAGAQMFQTLYMIPFLPLCSLGQTKVRGKKEFLALQDSFLFYFLQ